MENTFKFCECCGKYKAYRRGLCWGCLNEVDRLESEYNNFGDDAEDIGYGKNQQVKAERGWI